MFSSRKVIRRRSMQPAMWKPSVALSPQEEQIVKKIRKAKLFVFLRQHRHELCHSRNNLAERAFFAVFGLLPKRNCTLKSETRRAYPEETSRSAPFAGRSNPFAKFALSARICPIFALSARLCCAASKFVCA